MNEVVRGDITTQAVDAIVNAANPTLLDVIVRDKDPAEEEVPTVLFANPKESSG